MPVGKGQTLYRDNLLSDKMTLNINIFYYKIKIYNFPLSHIRATMVKKGKRICEDTEQIQEKTMLDFRIETFLEVCRSMNFTQAARQLNITQPAVSQHIKWLEECYGTRMFVMHGKKLQLTPAGEILRDSFATIQHDIVSLKEKVQEKEEKKKAIKMGLTFTIAEYEVAGSISRYLLQEPTVSMILSVGNTRELLRELEEGSIDFALVEGNFPGGIYHHELYSRQRYIAVCAASNPLSKGTYTIDRLLNKRLVIREAGSGTRNIMERYLEMKGLGVEDFAAKVETGNIGLIKQLVASGCGITFLYQTAVEKELKDGSLCEISLSDMEITHDFTFIWRKNSIFSEDYSRIFTMLKEKRDVTVHWEASEQ